VLTPRNASGAEMRNGGEEDPRRRSPLRSPSLGRALSAPSALSLHDDQVFRRRPKFVRFRNFQRPAELIAFPGPYLRVVQALTRYDLILLRRVRHIDAMDLSRVDRAERVHRELASRHQRAAETLDEKVGAAFLHDHAPLQQIVFGANHVVRLGVGGAHTRQVLAQVVDPCLQERDRLRLLLDARHHRGDTLLIRGEGILQRFVLVTELRVFGEERGLVLLQCRDLLGR